MKPENEARLCYCPLSLNTVLFCRGKDCMAWRWNVGEDTVKRVTVPEYPCPDERCEVCTPENSGKHIHEWIQTGYCGLAGKPEAA